jgi:hypothetical protein
VRLSRFGTAIGLGRGVDQMRKAMFPAVCVALLLCLGTVSIAAEGGDDKRQWFEKLKFGGDLRLRYEGFDWEDKFDDDRRDRFRYRLRFGISAAISEKLKVGVQLRSGNPDNPHSDNQSFDGGFDKDEISIAEVFVRYQPNDVFGITGGKFSPKKLWLVSDLQWDDDVVVEGAMESFEFKGSGGVLKSFQINAYQFVLEESSSSGDAYLIGAQIRPVFTINDKNQLTAGVGFHHYTRPEKVVALTLGGRLDTEPDGVVTNLLFDPDPVDPDNPLELVSDFEVLNAFAEWKNKASKRWPVKVSLFYYVNTGAEDRVGSIFDSDGDVVVADLNGKDQDTGYFARIQIGDYKKPGQVSIRLTRYDSEPDAMFYAWTQSDTRRGSNVDGHRFDVRVGMPLKGHMDFTYYRTDWKVGEDTTMNRWQLDYTFTF